MADQLTPEAKLALTSELLRRRIDAESRPSVQDKAERINVRRALPFLDSDQVGPFLAEVLRLYHSDFRLFVTLIAPAVVVGYFAILLARSEGLEIARHLPRGVEMLRHRSEIIEIWAVNLGGCFVSWMAFCFSFGAICTATLELVAGNRPPSVSYCFAKTGERIGSFLRLSLLLLFSFLLLIGGANLVFAGILWLLLAYRISALMIQVLWFACVGLALLLLSRFGLAIPAFVAGNCTVSEAMFRSDELTKGKWLTLGVLLAKSLIGGYIAGMSPFWLASWFTASTSLPAWFAWVLRIASVAAVTVVEPTMFIGLALLYVRASRLTSTSATALVQQA